jgi:hypothetical protein
MGLARRMQGQYKKCLDGIENITQGISRGQREEKCLWVINDVKCISKLSNDGRLWWKLKFHNKKWFRKLGMERSAEIIKIPDFISKICSKISPSFVDRYNVASQPRAGPHRSPNGGSKHLWNVGKFLPDYTAQIPEDSHLPRNYSIIIGPRFLDFLYVPKKNSYTATTILKRWRLRHLQQNQARMLVEVTWAR